MAIFDAFITIFFWTVASKCRSCSICKKESEDVPKIPRALIIVRVTLSIQLVLLSIGALFITA